MSADRDFNVWVPAEAFEKDGDLRIRGVVTTEHRDREGEVVLQDGLDFSEFLKHGYFNDNHAKDTMGAVLGYPLAVQRGTTDDGKKCHVVEGVLYKEYPKAKEIWHLAKAMSGDSRRARALGFSLQGKIVKRTGPERIPKMRPDGTVQYVGDTVSRAVVRHVAITASPVNPYTRMDALVKALMAGSDVSAPAAAPGQGFPLRLESLDRKMTKADAIEWLIGRGLTKAAAERVWRLSAARRMSE